jgi:hypothetical protein
MSAFLDEMNLGMAAKRLAAAATAGARSIHPANDSQCEWASDEPTTFKLAPNSEGCFVLRD